MSWSMGSALCAAALLVTLSGCGELAADSRGEVPHEVGIRDLSSLKIPDDDGPGIPAPPTEERVYDVDTLSASVTFARYYGYEGPWYSQLKYDTGLTVLDRSVYVSQQQTWTASLLVRNDTVEPVGTIRVTASLLDSAGQKLQEVSGLSPVVDARPGEPVPVSLVSSVPTDEVAAVNYEATEAKDAQTVERSLEMTEVRTWPYGDREPISVPFIHENADKDLPYTSLIYVHNEGRSFVTDFELTVGWIDNKGRLVYFTSATPVESDQSPQEASGGRDMLIQVDDADLAKSIQEFQQVRWGVGL